MTDDGRLLRDYVRRGSQTAFSALVARHLNFVYSVSLRETGNSALAEDVTQVVFLILAKKAPSLRPEPSLTSWLFQTARFAAKNARRRERRRQEGEADVVEQIPAPGQSESALWGQVRPALNNALASLGSKDREAVLLRFADGLSFPELGTALGTSEDAARMRLNRAVERLRQFFAKHGIVLSAAALVCLLLNRTVEAAPLSLTQGIPNSALQAHLTETLKAMTMAKLKLAAIVGVGIVFAGMLPIATRAQNHLRHPSQKTTRAAALVEKRTASQPLPLTVPRSLHIVYSLSDANHSPVPAEYWVAGPNAARWTWNGRYPTTIATDGKTWTNMTEPPNAGSVIKLDARAAAANPVPTQPSLLVERARSWNSSAVGVYGPGVLAGEVPFLGFGQPGKIYQVKEAKITKTANGWVEHYRVPYGYGSDSVTGKATLVDAVLTYDHQGRLIRFRRNRAGDIWETSVFSDFITIDGQEIPRLVQFTETDEAAGRVVTDTATTYQAKSFDRMLMPLGWFTLQHPPVGTFIQDYRFADHKPTPGLAGENSSGVLYRYDGHASLDEESRAQYHKMREAAAQKAR